MGQKVSDPGDRANMEEICRYSKIEEIKIVYIYIYIYIFFFERYSDYVLCHDIQMIH